MLKGVPVRISPELMYTLMKMGHGDELVLADGNFPAASNAQRLVRADGHGAPEMLEALENCLGFVVAHPQFTEDLRNLIAKARGES